MTQRGRATAIAAVITGAVLALAIALAVGGPAGSPPAGGALAVAPPAARRGDGRSFLLAPGTARAYRLAVSTSVTPEGSGAPVRLETALVATLNVRVLASQAGTELAVQLSPVRVEVGGQRSAALEAALATPFAVAIDARGRLGAARFTPGVAPGDRALLDGAIRSLQVVLPPDDAPTWEVHEDAANGELVAAYRRDATTGAIHKETLRYTSLRRAGVFAIAVEASALDAELDRDGPWLGAARGEERLRLEAQGGLGLARVASRFTLEPTGAPSRGLALWDDGRVAAGQVALDAAGGRSRGWDEAERAAQRERFLKAGVDLDGLVARLAGPGAGDTAVVHELAAFLRAFPGEARRIPGLLRRGGARSPPLLEALELASTPDAQVALAEVAEGEDQAPGDRRRALIALGRVTEPTAETVERLRRARDRWRGREATDELYSTAVLSLGAAAAHASDAVRVPLLQALGSDLAAAQDPREQRLLLLALENAGARPRAATIEPFLGAQDVGVRDAAVRVLAGSGDAGAVERLGGIIAQDKAPVVRATAVRGLLELRPTDASNGVLARTFAEGGDVPVDLRVRIASSLGRQAAQYPANRAILEAALPRERDRQVVAAIVAALRR